MIERAVANIATMSQGRLIIEAFSGGAVVPASKEFDAVNAGTIEVAYTSYHYNMDKFSAGGLYAIVVAGPPPLEYLTWYLDGGGKELLDRMVKDYNVVNVSVAQIGRAEMFGFSNKPLTSLADFKGLKFRTAGDWGEILTNLGASVIFLPGGEIYESFQRGVIDGFEYGSPAGNWGMGFHEIAKYGVFPGIHAPSVLSPYVVNKAAWANLPDDLKAIADHAWMSETLRFLSLAAVQDMEAIAKYKDYGLEFFYLPEDVQKDVEKAAAEFYDDIAAKDPFVAEVLKSMRDFSKAYRETDQLQFPYYK